MIKLTNYFLVLAWLYHNTALAQTRIEVKEKAPITAKVISYNEQLIHFQTMAGTLDSIPSEQVSAIGYGDSLRVLVFPESMKGKRQLLTQTQFLEAMQASDYATLFHGYTHLYDLQFTATKSGLLLTTESRQKLVPYVRMLKIKQEVHLTIAVHADSVGKAPTNQLLTERRAKAVSTELLRNGIAPSRFTILAKGESEPFLIRPSLSRRIEITVDKVAKTKVLYAQKYIPPPPKPVVVIAPPKAQENNQKPTQTTQVEEKEDEPNYRYWTLTVGSEAAQLLASQSPQWADEKVGMGLKMGVGGALQFTKRFGRTLGMGLKAGYTVWETEKKSNRNGELVYQANQKLEQISLQLAPKLYLWRGLYLAPFGSIQHVTLTGTYSESHPYRFSLFDDSDRQSTIYWGYGGHLGCEFDLRFLHFDLRSSYHILTTPLKPFEAYLPTSNPMHSIGINLSIGFKH